MELFRLYYEEFKEAREIVGRVILPVVRTHMGYGIFYWRVRDGKFYQFDVRTIMDAPAYFCNHDADVKAYDRGYCRLFGAPEFKLIDVSDKPEYAMTVIKVALESDRFMRTFNGWVK